MTNCFLKMPLNSFLGVEYLLWKLFLCAFEGCSADYA